MSIDFSDQDLVSRVRHGDTAAFGDLYAHHSAAAHRAARRIVRDPHVAEDVVSESFARVFKALQGGNGPTGDLFPYLLVTMRNVAASWGRESVKWTPVGDDTVFQPRDARDSVAGADELPVDRLNMSLTSSAFETLPRRWRTVLWYLEVEGESATDVGQRLGLSDVAVRQLARRAREGLREAYLAAYLGGEPAIGDHVPSADLVSMARGKLSLRRRAAVEKHLDTCPTCSGLLFQAAEENSTLRALALPFYLAAAFALARWWHGAVSLVPKFPGRTALSTPVGQAAAAVVATITVVSASLAVTPTLAGKHGAQAAGNISSASSSAPPSRSSASTSSATSTPSSAVPTSASSPVPTTGASGSRSATASSAALTQGPTALPTINFPPGSGAPTAEASVSPSVSLTPTPLTPSALPTTATPTTAAPTSVTPTTDPTTVTTEPTTPTTDPTTTDPTTPTTAPPPPPTLVETDGGLSTDLNGDTVFTFYIANNGLVAVHPQATITLPTGVILRTLPFWDCGYRPRMTVLNCQRLRQVVPGGTATQSQFSLVMDGVVTQTPIVIPIQP